MESTSSKETVNELRKFFCRFGIPICIVSDNGPQFVASEMKEFVRNNGIKHVKIAPYHPASNGQAEKFVQTFKKCVDFSNHNLLDKRIEQFLFAYRNSPHAVTGMIPASRILKFSPNTLLTICRQHNGEFLKNPIAIPTKFNVGENVMVRNFRPLNKTKWLCGIIQKQLGKVLYLVSVNGAVWKRHANQLRKSSMTEIPTFIDNHSEHTEQRNEEESTDKQREQEPHNNSNDDIRDESPSEP